MKGRGRLIERYGVHQVLLDGTLMVAAADDFLLFALVAKLRLGVWLAPVTLIEVLPATVISPETSEKVMKK